MSRRRTCLWCLSLCFATAHAGSAGVPPRIVSLSPHITELLFAAGAGSYVVGVDDASDYPDKTAGIARVGEVSALDVEALVNLKPTLVMLWDSGTSARRVAELARLKLKLLITEQRRLDDIGDALVQFGEIAGTTDAARAAAQRYRNDLRELRLRYAGRPRLRVFYQVWDRPMYTLSGGHVASEVLSLCGGENVFAELSTLAPAVDQEAVLTRDPEVILVAASGAEAARQIKDWGRFGSLRAVRLRHIYSVDPSLIGRMTPRILDGVRQVCRVLEQARDQR